MQMAACGEVITIITLLTSGVVVGYVAAKAANPTDMMIERHVNNIERNIDTKLSQSEHRMKEWMKSQDEFMLTKIKWLK